MSEIKLIAEIGWNHMGDMNLAEEMVRKAKESGADYAKFQTWKVDRLKPGPWDEDGRREIYQKAELTNDKHAELQRICGKYDIEFLTSCFCADDLDFLSTICSQIKIPSTECKNTKLVEQALTLFDRLFISTGATTEDEYQRWADYDRVTLLHCIVSYPCDPKHINMQRMLHLKELTPRFGYSGHLSTIWDAVLAISLGATVVEKHFTLDHNLPGRDNKFALLPKEFKKIREFADLYPLMSENRGIGYQEIEQDARDQYAGRWEK